MKKADVDNFKKVQSQMTEMYEEISLLSKKKQDDAVNKFKLKFINILLEKANNILVGEYKPFEDFTLFEEDALPTNSDVVMILKQYLSCLEKLRSDNLYITMGDWHWKIQDEEKYGRIKTNPPRR